MLCLFSCQNKDEEIRLLFTGDILLSRNVKQELNTHNNFPWASFQPLFQSCDFVAGNLEGAVGEYNGKENNTDPSPTFAIDSLDIAMLHQAGFTTLTIENNHVNDLGPNGKNVTISTLFANEIQPVSKENSPYFFQIDNVIFSLLAINLVPDKDHCYQKIPSLEIIQKLRLARKLSNIVIISVHWGSELLDWPSKEQRAAAEWLIMNGADIIIGHHPHIIQDPEIILGKPVFFSLGNHLFDQKYTSTKKGLIADIRIKNGQIFSHGIITHTKNNSFYPEVTDSLDFHFIPTKYKTQLFEINGIRLIPVSLTDEDNILLKGYIEDKQCWISSPRPIKDLDLIMIDKTGYCLFTLEKHFSSLDNEVALRPYVYNVDRIGITARWRGSGLAWPILDAIVSPDNEQVLCALHRGDAFIDPGNIITDYRTAAYQWNGFGFKKINDSVSCESCNPF
jgi:hypothetical protein